MTVVVIGMPMEGPAALSAGDRAALAAAKLVVAGDRHLADLGALASPEARRVAITADVSAAVNEVDLADRAGTPVVVVATGDPGLFGIGRALGDVLGPGRLEIRPAASSIAVAFGRVGLPWDDAVVVSAHGRPLELAVEAILVTVKAAVLTSPDNPPEAIGAALLAAGHHVDHVAVACDLGTDRELVVFGDLEWLASSHLSPLSVVLLWNGPGAGGAAALSWTPSPRFGAAEATFEHRGGMVTKAETRAICLARLELDVAGVMWDVGAGSGSVGIEAARLAPGLCVYAIERAREDCDRIQENAMRHGAADSLDVIEGQAPECLASLPDPDRAFVGGGGLPVLHAVLARLRPGGRVVATYASIARAASAAEILGDMAQISVSRQRRLPDGTTRLAALDPVFVCWGPA